MKATSVALEVYSRQDLCGIRSEWEASVAGQRGSILFTAPVWIANYWQFRGQTSTNATLVVGRAPQGQLVGLAPLVFASGLSGRIIPTIRAVHATGEYVSDWYCCAGYADAFVAAVCDYLIDRAESWTRLVMRNVPETSPILKAMLQQCADRALNHRLEQVWKVPFIATEGETRDSLSLVSSKYRRELRRRQKSLGLLGELRFEDYRTRDQLADRFEEFVTVESAGWKGKTGGAIATNESAKRFWWNVANEAARDGKLRLHLLRLNGKVISGQLGLAWSDRYYCLKLGYDETYRKYGPGALMTQHAIQCCIDDPDNKVYDFAGAAQPYIWNWTRQSYATYDLFVTSPQPMRRALYPLLAEAEKLVIWLQRALNRQG